MVKVMDLLIRCKKNGILTEKEVTDEKVYVILLKGDLDNLMTDEKGNASRFINLYCNMRYLRLIYNGFIKRSQSVWLMDGIGGFIGYYLLYLDMLIKSIESDLSKPIVTTDLWLPKYDVYVEKMEVYMSRTFLNMKVSEYFKFFTEEKIRLLQEIWIEIQRNMQTTNDKLGYLKINILKFEYIMHVLILSIIP